MTATPRRQIGRGPRRAAGAWHRFLVALVALVAVVAGIPALLVACSRAGLDSWQPVPGIGTSDEISNFFRRELTSTEIVPIALRILLIVGWLLWFALTVSVAASLAEASHGRRFGLPQLSMFAGFGRWIAAGLTALSAVTPALASATSVPMTSARSAVVSEITDASGPAGYPSPQVRPVAPGFARVEPGESIEMFAARTLGDEHRWVDVWEMNQNRPVDEAGTVWSAAWRISPGWDLRLPTSATRSVGASAPTEVPAPTPLPASDADAARHIVVAGDSYWAISESRLAPGATAIAVFDYTQALVARNAPALGYDDPTLIRPGDVLTLVELPVATAGVNDTAEPDPVVIDAPSVALSEPLPAHRVEPGDSYWAIATSTLPADATQGEVAALTQYLIELNASRLGYDDQRMIHPGDDVYLHDSAPLAPIVYPGPPAAEPTSDADVVEPTTILVAPPTTAPSTTVPAPTTTTTTNTTTTTTSVPAGANGAADESAEGPTGQRSPAPFPVGLGEAALLAGGVLALVGARRRARLRAAEPPARLPRPRAEAVDLERRLRRVGASERLLRLDIAVRAAAPDISARHERVVLARVAGDGAIELVTSGNVRIGAPWVGSGRTWSLAGDVPVDDLAVTARTVGAPCLALATVGVDAHGSELLVDIEALGVLSIDARHDDDPGSDRADSIVRSLAVALASSEFAEACHLIGVALVTEGGSDPFLGHRNAHHVATLDEAIELAADLVGTKVPAHQETFGLRARHTEGEAWEPAIVLVASSASPEVSPEVVADVVARPGLSLVVSGPVDRAPWTLTSAPSGWSLQPLGVALTPIGVDGADAGALADLFDSAAEPLEFVDGIIPLDDVTGEHDVVVEIDEVDEADKADEVDEVAETDETASVPGSTVGAGAQTTAATTQHRLFSLADEVPVIVIESPATEGAARNGHNGHTVMAAASGLARGNGNRPAPPVEPAAVTDWALMVRTFESVALVDGSGSAAVFERGKALELVAWMVTHRGRTTRTRARDALWDLEVRHATFANVVSEARRTMARHVDPPDHDEWLRRTLTDELSLHPGVVADADLMRAGLATARNVEGSPALDVLRPAVELVRGMPFAGTGYLWPDAEGLTCDLIALATAVCAEYAERALELGDIEQVLWATGRGLGVLAGQESLIGLRMRAHAESGDLSGVRQEWDSYERTINGDAWSDGEPAPKLVALRQQLLSR